LIMTSIYVRVSFFVCSGSATEHELT
jgi:hypothetical protein